MAVSKIQNQPTPRKKSLTISIRCTNQLLLRETAVCQLLTVSCFLFHRATTPLLSYQGSCSCRAAGESPPRSRTKGHRPWGRHKTAAARRRRPTQNTLSILFFCGNHESSPHRRRISSVDWRHRLLHSRARCAAHYVAYMVGQVIYRVSRNDCRQFYQVILQVKTNNFHNVMHSPI